MTPSPGLVTERLGRLPKAGEHPQVKEAGLTITVLEMEEQRIARLLLVKDPEKASQKKRKQSDMKETEQENGTSSQENALGTAPMGKLLFSLAVPAITAQVVNMLYNIVDRIYIGHIPEIGTAALTGVGITFPIITLISAFSSLIAMGGAQGPPSPWAPTTRSGPRRLWATALRRCWRSPWR